METTKTRIRNIYSASFWNPDPLLTDLQTLLAPETSSVNPQLRINHTSMMG